MAEAGSESVCLKRRQWQDTSIVMFSEAMFDAEGGQPEPVQREKLDACLQVFMTCSGPAPCKSCEYEYARPWSRRNGYLQCVLGSSSPASQAAIEDLRSTSLDARVRGDVHRKVQSDASESAQLWSVFSAVLSCQIISVALPHKPKPRPASLALAPSSMRPPRKSQDAAEVLRDLNPYPILSWRTGM